MKNNEQIKNLVKSIRITSDSEIAKVKKCVITLKKLYSKLENKKLAAEMKKTVENFELAFKISEDERIGQTRLFGD
jgi:hypothetical protein